MAKLLLSLAFILTGLALGYLVQVLDRSSVLRLPAPIGSLRKLLQKIALLFFMPISFLGAVWVVSFDDLRVALMPLVGVAALVSGGILALAAARLLRQSRKQTGVLFCCGSFTNIGAIGGLVCYLFLGEAGFALVALYKMFEEIIYYTVGFPLARFYSGISSQQRSLARRILSVLADPFVAAAYSAFIIGLLLNLTGITRPPFFETVTAISIPLGTFVLIVSIGLGMHFSTVGTYLRESICIGLIKFAAVPIIACTLAWLLGLHRVSGALPFKVVLILSSMPVAFNALIAASIYDLDLDLANSCWLLTTGALILILPWLYFLLSSPGLLP